MTLSFDDKQDIHYSYSKELNEGYMNDNDYIFIGIYEYNSYNREVYLSVQMDISKCKDTHFIIYDNNVHTSLRCNRISLYKSEFIKCNDSIKPEFYMDDIEKMVLYKFILNNWDFIISKINNFYRICNIKYSIENIECPNYSTLPDITSYIINNNLFGLGDNEVNVRVVGYLNNFGIDSIAKRVDLIHTKDGLNYYKIYDNEFPFISTNYIIIDDTTLSMEDIKKMVM